MRILILTGNNNKETVVSWKKELLLTVLMLGLVSFFAYWQVTDHLRLRKEQQKIISFLQNDIETALAGILNSQPKFGPIIFKEPVTQKIDDLMASGKGNPLNAIAIFNAQNKLLLSVKKKDIPENWYKSEKNTSTPYMMITTPYSEIATSAGLTGSEPVIGNRNTVTAMINLISEFSDNGKNRAKTISQSGGEIGNQIKKILSEDYFRKNTVMKVAYLLDADFLHQTISKDLILRSVSLIFCFIALLILTYSLFNLNRNVKLKILLTKEQEKNTHFQEMHLLAAGLAHEIKNPLNLVRGITQSIAELNADSREINKKTSIVAEEVDRINSRLNSFLAYSNLNSPSPKKIYYKKIIDEIIALLTVDCEDKNIQIKNNIKDKKIWADEESLRQILFNLMHNAIKAVDKEGKISVTSCKMKNKNFIAIQISDNGPGIPKESRKDIFKPYFTLDPSGTGLGLAIVKQLTFNHGWTIKYISTNEKGATFRIEGIKLI